MSRDWKGNGWYRITGEAGTKLGNSPANGRHCGTHAAGWLSGEHPTVAEGEVDRRVNFFYVGKNAWNRRDFIFHLNKLDSWSKKIIAFRFVNI